MREFWARRIALLTGLLVFLMVAAFPIIQNPANVLDNPERVAQLPSDDLPVPEFLDPQCIDAGRQIYQQQSCARCHSIAGKGNPRNPLDGVGAIHSEEQMRAWIIGADTLQGVLPGRALEMKRAYRELSGDDLNVLVIYMQSLRPERNPGAQTIPAAELSMAASGKDGNCLTCHSNAGHLMQVVLPPAAPPEDGCATAPSRQPFLNAFVSSEFSSTVHGIIGCTGCHSGDASAEEKVNAHTGMKEAELICADCHSEISDLHANSLHNTLNGMAHALKLRSGEANFHELETVWQDDCASCHAGCSDCHVTLPGAVGGGLIKGHEFFKRPPMQDTCVLCHGSRAGAEYTGKWEGVEPDVHFEAGMHCVDCHTNDLHGDGQTYTDRWQVQGRPQCADCHAALPNKTAEAHDIKHQDVSCQVCHSQPYQNCFSCHGNMEEGEYVRRVEHKGLDFKIGRNTVAGYPHDIVTLRNNPVARYSFDHFGLNLLPHFDETPTWKTVAPHNIQRVTQQNRSCENCHGKDELFLRESDLDAEGSVANKAVIMPPARKLGRAVQ